MKLAARAKAESLNFLTMWGAKRKLGTLTPEVEERIKEELTVFNNLSLAEDILCLKDTLVNIKKDLDVTPEPTKGILSASMVAYCLNLASDNPLETGAELNPMDFQLPLQLVVCFDNSIRSEVVDWLKSHDFCMSTYLGQPLLKLKQIRVLIKRSEAVS